MKQDPDRRTSMRLPDPPPSPPKMTCIDDLFGRQSAVPASPAHQSGPVPAVKKRGRGRPRKKRAPDLVAGGPRPKKKRGWPKGKPRGKRKRKCRSDSDSASTYEPPKGIA